MSYKTWVSGEVLTASDLNTYLMQQSVPNFANTAERDAAIASPAEGQFCYVTDLDAFFVYNGSWVAYDNTWKSWTPTWSGVTKGTSPTETYAYIRVGKLVIAHGSLTLSSTGTAGSLAGPLTVTLPIASSSSAISTTAGAAFFFDTSASATFQGTVDIATNSTTATIRASDSATAYLSRTALTSTIPFGAAWAGGDRIGFNVQYQVA
jgi:hypothetical protein